MSVVIPSTQNQTVLLVDDHDEVYPHWKSLNLKNKILVHLDEHSDFQWIHDKDPLTLLKSSTAKELQTQLKNSKNWSSLGFANREMHLGNYLCQVFKDQIVKKWYWVVPAPQWQNPKSQNLIWQELNTHYKYRIGPMTKPKKTRIGFETSIYGVKAFVGPLSSLPEFDEEVILNIDVDYLTFNSKDWLKEPLRFRRKLPWIWPEDLYSRLEAKKIKPLTTGIAHSINGGYTPASYKFFGQTLKTLFSKETLPRDYYELKVAISLREQNQTGEALKTLEKVGPPFEAAKFYQKAMNHYEEGVLELAQKNFTNALKRDSELTSKHNNLGPVYEQYEKHEYALEEYEMMSKLLPEAEKPLFGKASALLNLGQTKKAKELLYKVLSINPHHAKTFLRLGNLHMLENNIETALKYFYRTLEFEKTPEPNLYLNIGLCHFQQKNYEKAKQTLREALKHGCHTPLVYWLLAKAYKKLGYSKKSREFFMEALRLNLLLLKQPKGFKRAHQALKDILNHGK